MNRALAQRMVLCVAAQNSASTNFEEFTLRDWQENLTWLYKSGLTFPLLKKIENESTVPAAIRNTLQADFASNRLRMADMFQEFRGINEAFQAAGLCFAVQKGFSLIPEYCAEPAMRHQTDFDYLLAPQCVEQARSILRARGYIAEIRTETEHVLQTPLKTQPPEHNFFILQPSRSVELHLRSWQGSACDVQIPEQGDALERIESRVLQGHAFPALAQEDIFLGQSVHALRHIFYFWMRLSWLLEIAQFVRMQHDNTAFWNRVGEQAQWHPRIGEIIGVVLCLAEEVFQASIPPSLASWTTETLSPAPRLWVKRYGWEFVLAPAPGSKLSLLLEEHFAPRTVAWQASRRARLFPVHQPKALTAEPPVTEPTAKKRSRWRKSMGLLPRITFHFRSLLRYGIALPGWRWSLQHEKPAQARSERILDADSGAVIAGNTGSQGK